jgi:hypothetical protein
MPTVQTERVPSGDIRRTRELTGVPCLEIRYCLLLEEEFLGSFLERHSWNERISSWPQDKEESIGSINPYPTCVTIYRMGHTVLDLNFPKSHEVR